MKNSLRWIIAGVGFCFMLFFVGTGLCTVVGWIVGSTSGTVTSVQTVRISDAMPASIDVMGIRWRVEQVHFPESTGLLALTECDKHVLLIDPNGVHPRQSLIHELLHASVCRYNAKTREFESDNLWYNSKTQDGHEGFNNIAGVISELLARNPQLAQYESDGDIAVGSVDVSGRP